MGVVVVVRLGDVRGRAHLEQPLAHRQLPFWQAMDMGVMPSLFALVSHRDLEQPLVRLRWPL